MRILFAALAAAFLLVSPTHAADLRRPALPAVAVAPVSQTGWYVGAQAGYAARAEDFTAGVNVGYDFGPVRLEADFDRLGFSKTGANVATANLILEHTMGRFTPYALAGFGYVFPDNTVGWTKRTSVYTLGGGLRYSITTNLDLDARYRFVETTNGRAHEHVTTIGLSYRF